MPIGKACNAHFNLYNRVLFDNFNNTLSDIFACNCSESVLSFLCAAVGKKWVISGKVKTSHEQGLDGASSGFVDIGWDNLIFTEKTMKQIIKDPEMDSSGMGYEECNNIFLHNKNCYENGECKDKERLKKFIKSNFFLNKKQFNYDNVTHEFVKANRKFYL